MIIFFIMGTIGGTKHCSELRRLYKTVGVDFELFWLLEVLLWGYLWFEPEGYFFLHNGICILGSLLDSRHFFRRLGVQGKRFWWAFSKFWEFLIFFPKLEIWKKLRFWSKKELCQSASAQWGRWNMADRSSGAYSLQRLLSSRLVHLNFLMGNKSSISGKILKTHFSVTSKRGFSQL